MILSPSLADPASDEIIHEMIRDQSRQIAELTKTNLNLIAKVNELSSLINNFQTKNKLNLPVPVSTLNSNQATPQLDSNINYSRFRSRSNKLNGFMNQPREFFSANFKVLNSQANDLNEETMNNGKF